MSVQTRFVAVLRAQCTSEATNWNDPKEQQQLLANVMAAMSAGHKSTGAVVEQIGLGYKVSSAKGVSVLVHTYPGTWQLRQH